jgi:hypothetical protein
MGTKGLNFQRNWATGRGMVGAFLFGIAYLMEEIPKPRNHF